MNGDREKKREFNAAVFSINQSINPFSLSVIFVFPAFILRLCLSFSLTCTHGELYLFRCSVASCCGRIGSRGGWRCLSLSVVVLYLPVGEKNNNGKIRNEVRKKNEIFYLVSLCFLVCVSFGRLSTNKVRILSNCRAVDLRAGRSLTNHRFHVEPSQDSGRLRPRRKLNPKRNLVDSKTTTTTTTTTEKKKGK